MTSFLPVVHMRMCTCASASSEAVYWILCNPLSITSSCPLWVSGRFKRTLGLYLFGFGLAGHLLSPWSKTLACLSALHHHSIVRSSKREENRERRTLILVGGNYYWEKYFFFPSFFFFFIYN